jgi:hypothetical protein
MIPRRKQANAPFSSLEIIVGLDLALQGLASPLSGTPDRQTQTDELGGLRTEGTESMGG